MSILARQSLALAIGALAAIGLVQFAGAGASAAAPPKHDRAVSAAPAAWTPAVDNGSVRGFAHVGQTMVAVGQFSSVTPPGGSSVARDRAFAFDATTGALVTGFAPTFDGAVNAVLPGPVSGTVYVAGDFTRVSDKKANRITLLRVTDGSIVPTFKTPTIDHAVNTIERHKMRLYAGGNFTKVGGKPYGGLASFNASTGAPDGFVKNRVSERHNDSGSGAQGWVGVRDLEVTPGGTKMAVIGNFKKVDGLPRDQLVVLNLRGKRSAVAQNWRTRRYEPYCFNWAFDSYMRGLSVSPDGSYFVVTTTGGQNPGTLCDAAARFELHATGMKIQPTWVDYAGGDTLWGVEATEHAIYVGGHQRWMNNGSGSDYAGPGAVARPGIAALDSKTGLPLKWNAARHPRGVATYELYATPAGLWMGSDTDWVGNRQYLRPRLAFFPLAGGEPLAPDNITSLPATAYLGGSPAGYSALRSIRLTKKTAKSATMLPDPGIDFDQWRGSFLAGGKVWYGKADGSFKSRTFTAGSFGPEIAVNPYVDPTWDGVPTGSGNTYDGNAVGLYSQMPDVTAMAYSGGRLFYTRAGTNKLFWRWFSTDSGVIGSQQFTASAGKPWSGTTGMFATKSKLYYVTSKGVLRSIDLRRGLPAGSTTKIDSRNDWRARAIFLGPKAAAGRTAPPTDFSSSCVDLVCTFDASASPEPAGPIVSYEWDFGPGSGEGQLVEHEFAAAGTYTVELTVTDEFGEASTETHQIEVSSSQEPVAFVDAMASNQTAADPSVTVPASAQAGDVLLLAASVDGQPPVTAPDGWTLVGSEPTAELSSYVFSKVATESDVGSTVALTLDTAGEVSLAVSAYRNAKAVSTATASVDTDTTDHETPEVDVPAGSWVAWFWAEKSSPALPTSALAPGADVARRAEVYSPGPGYVAALLGDSDGPRTGAVPPTVAASDATSSQGISWSIILEATTE